jgi:hypothetical protein
LGRIRSHTLREEEDPVEQAVLNIKQNLKQKGLYIIDCETWNRIDYFLFYLCEINSSDCDKEWINNIRSIVRFRPLSEEIIKITQREWERGYNDGCTASVADLNVIEYNAAKKAREDERNTCITLAKEQINLERIEVLDYIYSFCNIQNCTRDCGGCKLSRLIGILEERKIKDSRNSTPAKAGDE